MKVIKYDKVTFKQFHDWFCELSDIDKQNFRAFFTFGVPKTLVMIAGLPDGQYKEMLLFVVNVKVLVRL